MSELHTYVCEENKHCISSTTKDDGVSLHPHTVTGYSYTELVDTQKHRILTIDI